MQQKLERYFQLCGNMLLPCFLFCIGLFGYLWSNTLDYDNGVLFHYMYLGCNLLLLLIFINFNRGRAVFFSCAIFIAYILINHLKRTYGTDMVNTAYYHNTVFLLPLNLLVFYLLPAYRFIDKRSVLYLLIIAFEYMITEILSRLEWGIFFPLFGINIVQWSIFAVLFAVTFIKSAGSGRLYDYSWMFAVLSLALGLHYSTNPVGLSLFFLTATIIMLSMVIYSLFYEHSYDEVTKLRNRASYLRDTKFLPPKYSLGIIALDDFNGLRRGLTLRQKNELLILTSDVCQEQFSGNAMIYHYYEGGFLIVCETMNLKEIREEFENIRRYIASLEFMLHNHPVPIKITVSGGVAEKKRTDTDVSEVLNRAIQAMQQTLKFSGNVISPILRNVRH